MIEIKVLDRNNYAYCSSSLQALESLTEYPYGADFFRIDHGSSYFSFFERLGEPIFHVAIDEGKVVACAAGVLRCLSDGSSRAWYLCDLKVHPSYRGQHLPSKLFRKNLLSNYFKCGRGYAISMNPSGSPNRVIKLIQKFSWLSFRVPGQLNFYSLAWDQMTEYAKAMSELIGPLSYLSLEGKKDLIMKSTNKRMKLLHIQHGPLAESQLGEPQQGAVHMICAVEDSPLDTFLRSKMAASAQASILAHRMSKMRWDFILTSDI